MSRWVIYPICAYCMWESGAHHTPRWHHVVAAYCLFQLTLISFLPLSPCSHNREDHQQAEVLYYSLEKGNMVPQIKHNPWSLKCHQQHLQRMKENSKHRNQHSILSAINHLTRQRKHNTVWSFTKALIRVFPEANQHIGLFTWKPYILYMIIVYSPRQ